MWQGCEISDVYFLMIQISNSNVKTVSLIDSYSPDASTPKLLKSGLCGVGHTTRALTNFRMLKRHKYIYNTVLYKHSLKINVCEIWCKSQQDKSSVHQSFYLPKSTESWIVSGRLIPEIL